MNMRSEPSVSSGDDQSSGNNTSEPGTPVPHPAVEQGRTDTLRAVSWTEDDYPQQSGYETPTPEDESSDQMPLLNGLLPPPLPLTSSEDPQSTSVSMDSETSNTADARSDVAPTGLAPSEGSDTIPHHQPPQHLWIGGEAQENTSGHGHEHEMDSEGEASGMPNFDAEMANEDTLASGGM